jgi:hypothetical protein
MIESQNKQIKAHLLSGKSITGLDALYMFGCWRLPARINDLKKTGLCIDKKMIEITSPSVFNNKKRVAQYRLKK